MSIHEREKAQKWKSEKKINTKFTTSLQIPCLRRVPFEATKRNQKSPLGAGPGICIARIAVKDAPEFLPYQSQEIICTLRLPESRALLW